MQFDTTSGTKCEVYSSLVGVLIEIMCVYSREECPLIKWKAILVTRMSPIIEYGLMPNYRDKTKKFIVTYNVNNEILTKG